MRKEKEQEELWLQKEVIEFLRCASSTFFTVKRYEKLRAKAIKDGAAESTKNLMFLHLLNICKNQFKPEATRVALKNE